MIDHFAKLAVLALLKAKTLKTDSLFLLFGKPLIFLSIFIALIFSLFKAYLTIKKSNILKVFTPFRIKDDD